MTFRRMTFGKMTFRRMTFKKMTFRRMTFRGGLLDFAEGDWLEPNQHGEGS